MPHAAAAEASRSPRCLGKSTPEGTPPTWCRARPSRCSPLATLGGAAICSTSSTAPMSIPSSSDEVATMHGSVPAFSRSSICWRSSRATEPWCASASSSPASSLIAAASFSPTRRALTKIIVERCARISSSKRGCSAGQIERRSSSSSRGLRATRAAGRAGVSPVPRSSPFVSCAARSILPVAW